MPFDKEGNWRANPKQEQFLALPLTIKEALLGGGAQSGKSEVLLIYSLVRQWYKNPRFKQVFMRRTFPELRNEIIPRSREFYPKFGATFNKTDMCWTFPREDQYGAREMTNDGAMIFLGHCETEDDVHKYDTMEINLFTPDELTSMTEWIYLYIGFERVRAPKDSGLPAIIRAAAMPGGIGHTFVNKRFVKPYPAGGKRLIGKGGNQRIYIHATLVDNEKYGDPKYAQSLEALPEAEKKAKKYGDWNSYLGQVFDEFRDKVYPDEPPNALHVINPIDIPDWWPRLVIGDWGFRAMTWIGFAAISPNKRLYIYREMHWIKTRIEEWAPYVKDYVDKENPRIIKFCKSAGQDRGQEHTIQQQISAALGRSVELTSNNPGSRVAGKMLIHEYMRWKPKFIPPKEQLVYNEEYAMWLMRNRGIEEYKSYLASFVPLEPEDNIPKLQIICCSRQHHEGHPNCCPILVEAIKACSYDKPKDNKPAEDIAEFEGDDPIDGLRYIVDAAEAFFDESKEEFEKIQKQELIAQQLQNTGDWTAFYRNMRIVESGSSVQPISRFHHA